MAGLECSRVDQMCLKLRPVSVRLPAAQILGVRMLRVLQAEEVGATQFNHFFRDWQYSGDGCIVGFLHPLPQTLKIQLGQENLLYYYCRLDILQYMQYG